MSFLDLLLLHRYAALIEHEQTAAEAHGYLTDRFATCFLLYFRHLVLQAGFEIDEVLNDYFARVQRRVFQMLLLILLLLLQITFFFQLLDNLLPQLHSLAVLHNVLGVIIMTLVAVRMRVVWVFFIAIDPDSAVFVIG